MDVITGVVCIVGGLFGGLLSFYLILCLIQWISDTIEHKSWRWWF